MSGVYPPFSDADATCPKCGGDMASEYQPAGTRYVPGVGAVLGHGPEWLLRRCTECNHAWPEMCADAEAKP